MKKFLVLFIGVVCLYLPVSAQEEHSGCYLHDMPVQKRINETGFRILNANKIGKHIVFSYNNKEALVKGDPAVIKRQIVIYDKDLKQAETDDELAALIAREISNSRKTFDGALGGFMSSLQVKMAPKKYEVVADKRAVDYLVYAGYNPLGLITYINKAYPQARQDVVSRRNLTSKRLMYIYEKIYFEYPYYLAQNEYINNPYYQNFLLNSIDNRRKLEQKIKNRAVGRVNYE